MQAKGHQNEKQLKEILMMLGSKFIPRIRKWPGKSEGASGWYEIFEQVKHSDIFVCYPLCFVIKASN